jgi:ribonuclease BN (tRNA processing enzyme)
LQDATPERFVELIVLGAGPAYTDRPGATGAAYLVRGGRTAIVLDLGQGSFPRLAAEIEPSRLDGVVVSHLHPDHFIDLVPLRHYLRFEFEPPRRVRVLGPAGLADRIDALHATAGFTAATLDVEALTDGATVTIGALAIESRRVTHTADSFGFRIVSTSGGPGLVYSGDCGRADDLSPLLRAGDTLLSEVSFGPGPVAEGALHLDGPSVGGLAASTGVGRVLLTHLQMGFDERATIASVRRRFDGPVTLVEPGTRLTI